DIQATVRVVSIARDQFRLLSTLYQNGRLVGTQDVSMGATAQNHRADLPDATVEQLAARLSAEQASELEEPSYLDHLHHIHNFPVHQQLTPRFADVDVDSQRSEAALARYMEQARFGGVRRRDFEGLRVMVAALDISFTAYHVGWTPLELAPGISQSGNSPFRFTGCALHKGEIQVAASSVMVVIDPDTGRPAPMPRGLREQLEGWLIE